jgi:hypothetical protein
MTSKACLVRGRFAKHLPTPSKVPTKLAIAPKVGARVRLELSLPSLIMWRTKVVMSME